MISKIKAHLSNLTCSFLLVFGLLLAAEPSYSLTPAVTSVAPDRGTRDSKTSVTIIGSNFEPGARVSLINGGSFFAGTYDTQEDAREVVVQANYAYVTDGDSGLFYIINISDPANPTFKSSINTSGRVQALYVSGDYAYVSGDSPLGYGLRIINISDPANPTLKGSYLEGMYGIFVSGIYLYTSNLKIIDISNPDKPSPLGFYDVPGAYNVHVQGNYAYVSTVSAGHSNPPSLQIINSSNPKKPFPEGSVEMPDDASDVYVQGNYAYVAASRSGLIIIDVSKPTKPAIVGSYDTSGNALNVTVSGNLAYVSDGDLQAIDISDPAKPILVNTYKTPGVLPAWSRGAYVRGNYAYLADGRAGLQVIKLNDPVTNVTVVSSNTITVTLPAGLTEGYYHILVTNPGGQKEEGYLYEGYHVTK